MKRYLLCMLMSITLFAKQERSPMNQFYYGTRILITGGCGFIGSHIAETLVARGAHVTILDNLSTGSLDNIASFHDDITFINGSITDFYTCMHATQNQDIIFHCAAFISVPASVERPRECHDVNVTGIINMLEAARQNDVSRFIFSSSAAVYGTREGVCSETDPCAPTSPYGLSKQMGELYCAHYAVYYGLGTVCLRYFNVYGPRQNPNGAYAAAVAKFRNCMEHDESITIFGDGMQTRDFIPVREVVNANLTAGMSEPSTMRGDIYNVATGISVTLLELVDTLREKFPTYSKEIQFAPERAGDIKHSSAHVAKLQGLLNASCSPTHSTSSG